MMSDNYFIKEGYKINSKAKTFETEFLGEYWTKERIDTSHSFQYDVYIYARDLIKRNNYKAIMDLGCGPATKTKEHLLPIISDITLIDQPNCEEIIKKTLPTAKFYGVNLESIDLVLNKKFDLIICADVIEHIYKPDALLEFIKNHLSDSGYLIISTPERDLLRGLNCSHSPHQAHIREWNKNEFKKLLNFYGFNVEKHILMPAQKLSESQRLNRKLFGSIYKKPSWFSCQTAICTYKSKE